MHKSLSSTNISVPALFRIIDSADQPSTLILDAADRLFGTAKRDEDNRDLIALLNNGFGDGSSNVALRRTDAEAHPVQQLRHGTHRRTRPPAGQNRGPGRQHHIAAEAAGRDVVKFRLRTDIPEVHDQRDGWPNRSSR